MSCSKWAYTPGVCDGGGCPGNCDLCDKPKNMEEEDDMTDYIKREDAARAMAQYMMDTALIDNPEASDRIEEWEDSIAAPVMSTVKAADVIEVVQLDNCPLYGGVCRYPSDKCYECPRHNNIQAFSPDFCRYGERADK